MVGPAAVAPAAMAAGSISRQGSLTTSETYYEYNVALGGSAEMAARRDKAVPAARRARRSRCPGTVRWRQMAATAVTVATAARPAGRAAAGPAATPAAAPSTSPAARSGRAATSSPLMLPSVARADGAALAALVVPVA